MSRLWIAFAVAAFGANWSSYAVTWPNEPAGSDLITDWGISSALLPAGWASRVSPITVVSDPTAPSGDGKVGQITYPVGWQAGAAPNTYYYSFGARREVFVGFYWKASDPWQQETGSKTSKIDFFMANRGCMFSGLHGPQGGPYLYVTGMEFVGIDNNHLPGTAGEIGHRTIYPNVITTPLTLGTWHRIEKYVKFSTTSTSRDGIYRVWIDGVLNVNHEKVNYDTEYPFLEFQISPTWGGTNNTKTQTDYYWFDALHVSQPHGAGPVTIPLSILSGTLPSAQSGKPYSASLQAQGGKAPYSWTIVSGNLLPGLSLNKSTGIISGVPTTGGRSNFTVKVLDSSVPAQEATKACTIIASGTATIHAAPNHLDAASPGHFGVRFYDISGRQLHAQNRTRMGSPFHFEASKGEKSIARKIHWGN